MKILTIEDTIFPPRESESSWTDELKKEYEEADIVLYIFSPYSHLVLKGPDDLVVKDARHRWTGESFVVLNGSSSEEECQAENVKLRRKTDA